MKLQIVLGIGLFSLSFMACGGNHDQHNVQDPSSTEKMMETTAPQPVKLKQPNLDAIYQHYIHLSNALVKEDVSDARIAAAAINKGAEALQNAKLLSSSKKIIESGDLEQQRRSFSEVSNELISLAKSSGLASGELYVDFCPMAMDDKGAYWLSSSKEIKNPYYGSEMLTCGEISDTIK